MSLSTITVSGTLKRDPEKRFTPTNIPVTNLLLEVCFTPRASQAAVQNEVTSQVIRVNAWRDLALECEKKLKTGDKVLIVGRAQVNAYTTGEGKRKREIEIDANSVTLIDDVLKVQAPRKIESADVEPVSSLNEVINSTEEIPF